MRLLFHVSTSIPSKADWSAAEPQYRQDWRDLVEALATWFCKSNGFNAHHQAMIIAADRLVLLDGEYLRYLAPSYRSVISLLAKAFQNPPKPRPYRSTPGITVFEKTQPPVPDYQICYADHGTTNHLPNISVVAMYPVNGIEKVMVPATTAQQAVVWLNYGMN